MRKNYRYIFLLIAALTIGQSAGIRQKSGMA